LKNIIIFASGKGSNAQNIIEYFKNSAVISVALIVSNNAQAGVIQVANNNNIPYLIISKTETDKWVQQIISATSCNIDLVVLAGFLLQIPKNLIQHFPNKIVNIHPALLPKFGGKGMYGSKVHQAVIAANETESGITIHFVNEKYDEGKIIFQASCPITSTDTIQSLQTKIQQLEHEYFAKVVEDILAPIFNGGSK
jgi:phosphoribosylglycinamide formyltransferase-1